MVTSRASYCCLFINEVYEYKRKHLRRVVLAAASGGRMMKRGEPGMRKDVGEATGVLEY